MEIINNLNITDWVIVAIFGISIIYGFMRGLFKEMGALVTWIAAFLIAYTFYDEFSAFLAQYVDNQLIRQIISVVILILAVIFIGGLINMFLSYVIGMAGLGSIDKLLGGAFGYLRAGLLVGIVAFAFSILNISNNQYLANSVLLDKLEPYGEWAYNLLPENIQAKIESETESVIDEDALGSPEGITEAVSETVSNAAAELQSGVNNAVDATENSTQDALQSVEDEVNDANQNENADTIGEPLSNDDAQNEVTEATQNDSADNVGEPLTDTITQDDISQFDESQSLGEPLTDTVSQ